MKVYRLKLKNMVRRLSGWAWTHETDLAESMAILKEMHVTPGNMELTIKQRPELAQWVAQCFAEMVTSSPNYTEMTFETLKPESWEWLTVTVKKGSGKTPHSLRMEAEKERDEMKEEAMKYIHLYHQSCIELESLKFGPETINSDPTSN